MFEAVARELRAKLVGTGKQIHNRGFPAAQTPRHTPRRRLLATLRTTDPSRKTPPHALSRTDDEAAANTSRSSPTVPTSRSRCRYAEGPTWRSAPRHIPSTQCEFSQMTPHDSSRRRDRATVARAVFPCTTSTVGSQPCGSPQAAWEFPGTLHPGVDAPRPPCFARAPGRMSGGAAWPSTQWAPGPRVGR